MKWDDEKLINEASEAVSRDGEDAVNMLCLLLSRLRKFKDSHEWSFVSGKLFALVTEDHLQKSAELCYDEIGAAVIDEEIGHLLTKFSVSERANIAGFLKGASQPLTLDKIEAIAGRV